MPAEAGRAMLLLALVAGGWLLAGRAGAAENAPAGAAEPATTVANKSTEISLPIKDEGLHVGDIAVRITSDNAVSMERSAFLEATRRLLRPEAFAALESALPAASYLTLAQAEAAGMDCQYDPENLEIKIHPKVEQRPRGEITGSLGSEGVRSEDLAKEALTSGYINMRFGAAYDRDFQEKAGTVGFPVGVFDGALRVGGVVLEGEFDAGWNGSLLRRGTRMIYDRPSDAIRVTAGDLTASTGGARMLPPMAGVAIEKSFQKLQPTRNIRPTGRRSFRIERPSEIDVLLNDHVVRRLRVGPGEYDLDALPLVAGNNKVKLRIKDDAGREEELDFSILFDRSLLSPGLSEWQIIAGIASERDGLLTYAVDDPLGQVSYRLGVKENLTGEWSVQADKDSVTAGVGALMQTAIGLVALDGAASGDVSGRFGWSGSADVEFALPAEAEFSSLHLGLAIDSEQFAQPGRGSSGKGGRRLRISGSYSRALDEGLTGTVSARYAQTEGDHEDAYGLGLSVSRALGEGMTASLSSNYSSETDAGRRTSLAPGLSVVGRLSFRLGETSGGSITVDPLKRKVTANAGMATGNGVGGWSAEVEYARQANESGEPADNSIETSFSYTGNRFELSTSHGRDFVGLQTMQHVHHAATMGTAIAFVDGQLAVGRPVRSSFALVDTHPSLDASKMRLQPSERGDTAVSDGLGPVLFSDISAYVPSRINYDVDDLPPGYDVGSGAFDVNAAYKSGYHLTVGSGFLATITGYLKDAEGKPLRLLSGTAHEQTKPDRKVELFTNADGRFGVSGFGPGTWVVEMAGETSPRYIFALAADAAGVIDLGELSPAE
jgi:outer membrane usher protein